MDSFLSSVLCAMVFILFFYTTRRSSVFSVGYVISSIYCVFIVVSKSIVTIAVVSRNSRQSSFQSVLTTLFFSSRSYSSSKSSNARERVYLYRLSSRRCDRTRLRVCAESELVSLLLVLFCGAPDAAALKYTSSSLSSSKSCFSKSSFSKSSSPSLSLSPFSSSYS